MKLSVIIPTLGGIQLKDTIKALQNSSIQPLEILICIPNSSKLVENIDLSDNIKILRTKKKGQVYQRMIGFLAAKGEFVLQIDDDIVLEKDSIEKLLDCFDSLVGRVAIAPKYVWKGTNISVFPGSHDTLTQKFSDWIMNGKIGYKPGTVSLSGVGFGLDFNDKTQDKNQSEWLPGACVLHRLQDVITLDYFPFSGKAYSEDLIHSYLLRGNGLKLYVCNSAIAYMEPIFYRDSLIELYRQYKATRYVANLQGKGFVRLHLLYFMRLFKMIVRVVTKTIRSFI